MSTEKGELHWRETYYILFPSNRRPTLTQIDASLATIGDQCQLKNREANDDGFFESILVESPDDHSAVEISYEMGELVTEQSLELAKEMQDELSADQLTILLQADARLDVMHFERVAGGSDDQWGDDEDEMADMLDPTCLLLAVEALADLTDGVPVDPASGSVLP